ncbi:MAG: hypothetical protein PVI94_12795, partial [Desulfobacterales bacterium]
MVVTFEPGTLNLVATALFRKNMLNTLKIIKNNRGIALLITISVTTILVAAALEYNRRARFAVISTAATRDH